MSKALERFGVLGGDLFKFLSSEAFVVIIALTIIVGITCLLTWLFTREHYESAVDTFKMNMKEHSRLLNHALSLYSKSYRKQLTRVLDKEIGKTNQQLFEDKEMADTLVEEIIKAEELIRYLEREL